MPSYLPFFRCTILNTVQQTIRHTNRSHTRTHNHDAAFRSTMTDELPAVQHIDGVLRLLPRLKSEDSISICRIYVSVDGVIAGLAAEILQLLRMQYTISFQSADDCRGNLPAM